MNILSICDNPDVLKIMNIIVLFINIIKIAVPIILILALMIRLTSAVAKSNEDAIASIKKTAPANVIAAVLIFLVPTLVGIVTKISFPNSEYAKCLVGISNESISLSYESRIEGLIENAEKTLSMSSYNAALNYLKNIKDENKKNEYKKRLDAVYEKILESQKIQVKSVNIVDTVVNIEVSTGSKKVAGYYFSSIEKTPALDGYDWINTDSAKFKTVKFPGTYYLYVKDTNGYITEPTKVVVPENFDVTLMHKGKKLMPVSFATYLPKHGSSLEEFNKKIASYNKRHGLRTRESVVVGAMAFTSEVQSWGYYMPYGGSNDTISKDSWGVYKYWGGGESRFLACDPFVVWCYKNAGLNIWANRSMMRRYTPLVQVNKDGKTTQEYKSYSSPTYKGEIRIYYFFVGIVGSTNEIGDNIVPVEQGQPGDILQNGHWSGHEMLVIDKYDDDMDGISDGYIVLQSRDIGLCYEKRPYKAGIILYDMTKVFNNTANFADHLYGWKEYYIPTSDYPDYLK